VAYIGIALPNMSRQYKILTRSYKVRIHTIVSFAGLIK